jgi:hypothetical protein
MSASLPIGEGGGGAWTHNKPHLPARPTHAFSHVALSKFWGARNGCRSVGYEFKQGITIDRDAVISPIIARSAGELFREYARNCLREHGNGEQLQAEHAQPLAEITPFSGASDNHH